MFPIYLVTFMHPDHKHLIGYVGCIITPGRSLEKRFKEHCGKVAHCVRLHRAIKKYGQEWFQIEQIDSGNTVDQTLMLEKWWIKRLGTKTPNGYNLTDGGEGCSGFKRSEEQCQKLIERLKGNKYGLGHRLSEENKHKVSVAQKARVHRSGWHHTDDAKRRIAAGCSGHTSWAKGKVFSAEHREKLRLNALRREAKRREAKCPPTPQLSKP